MQTENNHIGMLLRTVRTDGNKHRWDPCDSNLFARLHPKHARALYTKALVESPCQLPAACWSIHAASSQSTSCKSGIEFLPISITLLDTKNTVKEKTFYVSYNGGDIHGDAPNVNESNPEGLIGLSSALDIPCGILVSVKALSYVVDADQCFVEPLTTDDWELLEVHSSWLEQGGLLQQVCIIYPEQILTLTLGRDSVVKLRVLGNTFLQKNDRGSNLWLGLQKSTSSIDSICPALPCLRLVADTKVLVSPKIRGGKRVSECSPRLRLIPSKQDYYYDLTELKVPKLPSQLVSVLPFSAVVHPDVAADFDGNFLRDGDVEEKKFCVVRAALAKVRHKHERFGRELESSVSLVCLHTSTAVPLGCIALHPLVRLKLQASLFMDLITLSSVDLLELDQKQHMIMNFFATGTARLSLQPVQFRATIENPDAPWRTTNSPFTGATSNLPNSFDLRNELQRQSKICPVILSRLLVEIGGFIIFPWCYPPLHSAMVYAVLVEYDIAVPNDQKVMKAAISAAYLYSYLSQVEESVRIRAGEFICNSVVTSSVQFNPLSPRLLLVSSVATLLPKILEESSVLLCGDSGCGKTTLAVMLAASHHVLSHSCMVYLNCQKLKVAEGVHLRVILDEVAGACLRALRFKPSVLVLDDFDKLIRRYESSQGPSESNQLQTINRATLDQCKIVVDILCYYLRRIAEVNSVEKSIVVITVCNSADSISALHSCNYGLAQPFDIPPLSISDRNCLFQLVLNSFGRLQFNGVGTESITEGLCPRDIKQISHRIEQCSSSTPGSINPNIDETLLAELQQYIPLARLGTEHTQPTFCWSDIGGLFEAKAELRSMLVRPSKYRKIYGRSMIRLPRGILLYGFPGCGKSLIPAALAVECGYQLVSCRGPELLDKYIGSTEAKVRELFKKAKHVAPSIIFLDELDSLAPIRGSDHTGVTDRIVNQLLTFLDGVEDTADGASVYVVGATSAPHKVDYALLRPGRLEKHIYIGYPETSEEWIDLATKVSRAFNLSPQALHQISTGSLFNQLSSESGFNHRFSGADMNSAFCAARLSTIHAFMENEDRKSSIEIDCSHLRQAFLKVQPSLSENDYNHLINIYASFQGASSRRCSDKFANVASTSLKFALK